MVAEAHQTAAAEIVALPLELDGVPTERTQRAAAALEELALGTRGDRHPDELSGADRQRVAIALAARSPAIGRSCLPSVLARDSVNGTPGGPSLRAPPQETGSPALEIRLPCHRIRSRPRHAPL